MANAMALARLVSAKQLGALASKVLAGRDRETVAAVDLGSNSFHMIVGRVENGQLHVLDRLQEMVRLAVGLDARHRLDKNARTRALICLERFGQRLRDLPAGKVRAVGTDTLRRARKADKFLAMAERALGHPIEVISGQEEARLIYHGVTRNLPADESKRLVVDIGGGSTEFIIGRGGKPLHTESLHMGCVGMTETYFPDGIIHGRAFHRAETAARLELRPVAAEFHRLGWERVLGSSGTVRAIAATARAQSWSDEGITLESLYRLRDAVLKSGDVKRLKLTGLTRERAQVLPGGLAILIAAFEDLGIERMEAADGALREGLLYDLLGRMSHEDVRQSTVNALVERYRVDAAQAERVERTAREAFAQVPRDWRLGEEDADMLGWAARLHEIGLTVAHTKYHRHGAYLVEHSDLPGFSYQEQRLLAALIRGHRRRFPEEVFGELPKPQARKARRLCILLRFSVLLHRSRTEATLPEFHFVGGKHSLRLRFPRGWLRRHPLTRADLAQEADYLARVGVTLDAA